MPVDARHRRSRWMMRVEGLAPGQGALLRGEGWIYGTGDGSFSLDAKTDGG